ncbi:LytTR family transcriptional regulator DNA-binding domain-containing protein [Spongiimicrobium salis]|uniref:LytTR family transcriptional regulator DNA-binding domain-containing protein n=1 Tax=Spongiimicrobium salis TaxID=1667022 RepID=UPI00374D8326
MNTKSLLLYKIVLLFLKPIFLRFSFSRYKDNTKFKLLNTINRHYSNIKKLWVSQKRGVFEGIEFEDMLYIKAEDHYINIFVIGAKPYLVKSSLRDFYEKYLVQQGVFHRLSKSYIVNLNQIYKIENNRLFLNGDTVLKIPKNRQKDLLMAIGAK